jgi:hypothetical protein
LDGRIEYWLYLLHGVDKIFRRSLCKLFAYLNFDF